MTALDAVAVALAIIAFARVSGGVSLAGNHADGLRRVRHRHGAARLGAGADRGRGVELLGEVGLAVILLGDAVRIDVRELRRELGLPARLLGIGPFRSAYGRA